jgi:hypothetical protein
MRIRVILLFFLFMPIFAHSQTPQSLDAAVQNCERYLQGRFPKGTRAALIAVAAESPELGEFAHERLSAALVNGGWFTVVERNDAALASIEREMERHLNFEVSEETELSIGRQLGAEVIISGALVRFGQDWRLDVHAVRVETAQRAGQWSSVIQRDPVWASLAVPQERTAGISFAGDPLSERERRAVVSGLRSALQTHRVDLDLDESRASATGYGFAVTVYIYPLPAAPPANIELLQAEVAVYFQQGGRILHRAAPYHITETNEGMIARRIAERLAGDRAFFNRINDMLR